MTAAMPSSLEASPLETEIQRAPAPDQPGEQEPVLDPVGGPGRRVLLAEDSPITQDLLKLLLNQRGHQVDVAMDGEQALEALRRNTYDVALLDFHLPKMDGLQVAAAVRSQTDGRPLPRLIAITADVEGLLAHAEGCDNFDLVMPKPLDIYQVGAWSKSKASPPISGPKHSPRRRRLTPPQRAGRPSRNRRSRLWASPCSRGRATSTPSASPPGPCKPRLATPASTAFW
ncbi:response regulator [Methyloceanibacter superfactus]|uniref:response regulator n=1 Tax=Methyloceanibacter superfactus TaxID=1774969 RepID=UPI0009F4F3FF|nr:response regulator [Methyloceanibacter superfactus]